MAKAYSIGFGQVETGHLLAISGDEVSAGESGTIPTTNVAEKLTGINFNKFFRVGFDYAEHSGISQNNEFS